MNYKDTMILALICCMAVSGLALLPVLHPEQASGLMLCAAVALVAPAV